MNTPGLTTSTDGGRLLPDCHKCHPSFLFVFTSKLYLHAGNKALDPPSAFLLELERSPEHSASSDVGGSVLGHPLLFPPQKSPSSVFRKGHPWDNHVLGGCPAVFSKGKGWMTLPCSLLRSQKVQAASRRLHSLVLWEAFALKIRRLSPGFGPLFTASPTAPDSTLGDRGHGRPVRSRAAVQDAGTTRAVGDQPVRG